jgi:hypothetical protein
MARRVATCGENGLAVLVASTGAKLLQQRVIVLEVGIESVNLQNELAKKRLKVKFRMDDTTIFKTAARCATSDKNGDASVLFNTVGDAIFEGGDNIGFELCESCRFSSSRTLATCGFPLTTALSVFPLATVLSYGESSQVHKMKLTSVSCPGKVVGELQIKIGIRTPTLHAAGGIRALRRLEVPEIPKPCGDRPVLAAEDAEKESLNFVEKATKALELLQLFLDSKQILVSTSGDTNAVDSSETTCGIHTIVEASTTCGSESTRSCATYRTLGVCI